MGWKVTMLNAECDRCGKESPELHPWQWTEEITYRGKVVEKPWMCVKCFMIEKRKMRAALQPSAQEEGD